MDTRTRPKRKNRVLAEAYDSYTFYLPVEKMERFRRAAEERGRAYSAAAEEAIDLYLAVKSHIPDMDNRANGSSDASQ